MISITIEAYDPKIGWRVIMAGEVRDEQEAQRIAGFLSLAHERIRVTFK